MHYASRRRGCGAETERKNHRRGYKSHRSPAFSTGSGQYLRPYAKAVGSAETNTGLRSYRKNRKAHYLKSELSSASAYHHAGTEGLFVKDNLKAYKLRLGDTSYIPGMEAGLVYAAVYKGDTMQGGEKIYQGSKIDLIIVSGEAKSEINVPNFVGKTYDEILTYITQYNLVPVFYVNPLKGSVITDTSEAKIIYQIPPQYNEKGEPNKLSIGQPISLCLMQNPAPEDYDNAKNIAPPQPPVADTSKKNSRIINDNEDK